MQCPTWKPPVPFYESEREENRTTVKSRRVHTPARKCLWTSSNQPQGYLHNGFSNVQKWFLNKFADTMDLPSRYDKVFWLIILQHQPHSLERERERQIHLKVILSGHFGNTMLSNAHNQIWPCANLLQKSNHYNDGSYNLMCIRNIWGLSWYECLGLVTEARTQKESFNLGYPRRFSCRSSLDCHLKEHDI